MREKTVSSVKIDFRLTPEEKEMITEYCKSKGVSRSEFIRSTVINKIKIAEVGE